MVIVDGLLFLAADTARSRAYAQALAAAGLAPRETLAFGVKPRPPIKSAPWPDGVAVPDGVVLPDFSESLAETAERSNWDFRVLDTDSVNSERMLDTVRTTDARLVLYSGFGGELVGADVLNLGVPFLHIHSGWLPDKPGSTTMYYSFLEDDDVGVSAFLLEPAIDTGPVVVRKRFPFPVKGVDVDYLYDGALRGAVMVEAIRHVAEHGELPAALPQTHHGSPYYVIHPVLKHLALLRLG